MAYRVSLANGVGGRVGIGLREQVLADKPLDVASVTWDLLISNHVVWTACPVFREPTEVSVDHLILVNLGDELAAIEPRGVINRPLDSDWMSTIISKNLVLDLACSSSKSLVFGGNVSGIAWQVLLFKVRWSCKSCHISK